MGLTQKLGTIPLAIFTDASNNIGIGGSPSGSYKFEVTGTGRFTSTLLVSGAATLGTGTSAYTFGGGSAAAGGLTDKDLTLKAWSPTSGTNEYGGDLILAAGVGTGNTSGKLGNVIVRVGTEGATSSTLGTLSTIATFTKTGLGIGTSSPNCKLDVLVASNNRVQIGTGIIGSSGEYVGGLYYASNKLRIESFLVGSGYQSILLQPDGGNVLLGTSSDVGQRLRIFQPSVAQWNIKLIQLDGSNQLFQEFLTTTDNDATNAARGSIRYNGTNVLYLGTSDYRLKEDLKDYNGLNIISQIKTYNFNWKEANTRDYGVMAHELQEVLPNYVTGAKDDINEDGSINPQQVDYSKLVPVLIKAIQELSAKVSALENKS